jgi:hypothetical protein
MELGKIKTRIREKGCKPSIPMVLPGTNRIIWVVVEKASLMAELDKVFPTKVSETGLMFDGEKLMPAKGTMVKSEPAAEPEADLEDDDLLSSGDDLLDDDDLLA